MGGRRNRNNRGNNATNLNLKNSAAAPASGDNKSVEKDDEDERLYGRLLCLEYRHPPLDARPALDPGQLVTCNEDFGFIVMEMDVGFLTSSVAKIPIKPTISYKEFLKKFQLFKKEELAASLSVTRNDFHHIMQEIVPCVGCRRNIEDMYREAGNYKSSWFYYFEVTQDAVFRINPSSISCRFLYDVFHCLDTNGPVSTCLSELSRIPSNRRCAFHSLASHRPRRPQTLQYLWDSMDDKSRNKIGIIEHSHIKATVQTYLKDNRFCAECRRKVQLAYKFLVSEPSELDGQDLTGFNKMKYDRIQTSKERGKIKLPLDRDLINNLICKGLPELGGNSGSERHAKTVDVAQDEVLTCVGICVCERLFRVQQRMLEEELSWRCIMSIGVKALRQVFEIAVDKKLGKSQLDVFLEELEQEKRQKLKKQQNKQQRKQRKKEKKNIEAEASQTVVVPEAANNSNLGETSPITKTCASIENTNMMKESNPYKTEKITVQTSGRPNESSTEKARQVVNAQKLTHKNNPYTFDDNQCKLQPRITTEYSKGPGHGKSHADNKEINLRSTIRNTRESASPISHCSSEAKHNHDLRHTSHRNSIEVFKDFGYSSENVNSLQNSEGSEIACSEGFCNHNIGGCASKKASISVTDLAIVKEAEDPGCKKVKGKPYLTLIEQLEGSGSEEEESGIPDHEVKFAKSAWAKLQKEKLRDQLLKNFKKMRASLESYTYSTPVVLCHHYKLRVQCTVCKVEEEQSSKCDPQEKKPAAQVVREGSLQKGHKSKRRYKGRKAQ